MIAEAVKDDEKRIDQNQLPHHLASVSFKKTNINQLINTDAENDEKNEQKRVKC